MNTIKATLKNIKSNGSLNLLEFESSNITIKVLTLELPKVSLVKELEINSVAILKFKSFSLIIGEDLLIANRFLGEIIEIEEFDILSRVVIKSDLGLFETNILSENVESLKQKKEITFFIKPSEIVIDEVISD